MSVDALYLGRNQAGAKYIVYDRDAKRFSLAQDADRALAILEKDLNKHASRYDSEKLRNTIAPRDFNYDLIPLSSLSSRDVMNRKQAEHTKASAAVLEPSLKVSAAVLKPSLKQSQ